MEASDFEAAQTPVDGWRSAIVVSGAQCVMIYGVLRMPELHVDNWDCPQQVL